MQRRITRKLFLYCVVGLPYIILISVWKTSILQPNCKPTEHVEGKTRKNLVRDTHGLTVVRANKRSNAQTLVQEKTIIAPTTVKDNVSISSSSRVTLISNDSRHFKSDFPVLTDQPALCAVTGNRSIDVVFLIESSVTHLAHRNAIRNTWASVTRNNTSNFRHVFMFGTVSKASQTRALQKEGQEFHDVVVSGFRDSYSNLTLKTISALRWFTNRCQHARYFVKVDDDVWINAPVVLSLLKNHSDFLHRGLGGHCSSNIRVQRNPKSKWYVPREMYPHDRFSPYCVGMAYTGSFNVAQQIVAVSAEIPFFVLEDVFVGMCLKRLGYGVKTLGKFRNKWTKDVCQQSPAIMNIKPAIFFDLWNADCPTSR